MFLSHSLFGVLVGDKELIAGVNNGVGAKAICGADFGNTYPCLPLNFNFI